MILDDPARASFTSWLYRPYIDLKPVAPEGNPQTKGLLMALASVEAESDEYPRVHGLFTPSLRVEMVRQARLPEFHLHDPLNLPMVHRTPQWQTLCANLAFDERAPLAQKQRVRVFWLLHRLHLHRAVLDYSQHDELADIAFIRGMSRYALYLDSAGALDTNDLLRAVNNSSKGSWPAIEATYVLAAIAAKETGDPEQVRPWADEHNSQIAHATLDDHTEAKLKSRFWRVDAFVPMLAGRHKEMVKEMDAAEVWAMQMHTDTPEHAAEASAVACALWESRTKEALLLGDLDLAEERARRYVRHGPLFPTAHTTLGQVLVERKKYGEAIDAYRAAARYGPPGSEIARFMIGQCWEQVGAPEAARDAYLSALDLDPQGVASLEQLILVARQLDDRMLAEWVASRLAALSGTDPRELQPYQQYEGALGT